VSSGHGEGQEQHVIYINGVFRPRATVGRARAAVRVARESCFDVILWSARARAHQQIRS
jgi:hypothetical protein